MVSRFQCPELASRCCRLWFLNHDELLLRPVDRLLLRYAEASARANDKLKFRIDTTAAVPSIDTRCNSLEPAAIAQNQKVQTRFTSFMIVENSKGTEEVRRITRREGAAGKFYSRTPSDQ